MPQNIFISYARPNLDAVRSLADYLRSMSFHVWFDKDSLLGGDEWESVILKEIKNARVFLVCLSAEAVDRRGYFYKEMRTAIDVAQTIPPNCLYILPIRINDCAIPDALSRYHVLDLFEGDWKEKLAKSLQKAFPEANTAISTMTINTRPITGNQGQIMTISYDPNQSIYSLLTQVYYSMSERVSAYTYGQEWVLRNDESGDLYDAENEQQRRALQFATVGQLGLKPNMKLSTVFLRDYRGTKPMLPKSH